MGSGRSRGSRESGSRRTRKRSGRLKSPLYEPDGPETPSPLARGGVFKTAANLDIRRRVSRSPAEGSAHSQSQCETLPRERTTGVCSRLSCGEVKPSTVRNWCPPGFSRARGEARTPWTSFPLEGKLTLERALDPVGVAVCLVAAETRRMSGTVL